MADSFVTVVPCCAYCYTLFGPDVGEPSQTSLQALVGRIFGIGIRVSYTFRMTFPIVIDIGILTLRAI